MRKPFLIHWLKTVQSASHQCLVFCVFGLIPDSLSQETTEVNQTSRTVGLDEQLSCLSQILQGLLLASTIHSESSFIFDKAERTSPPNIDSSQTMLLHFEGIVDHRSASPLKQKNPTFATFILELTVLEVKYSFVLMVCYFLFFYLRLCKYVCVLLIMECLLQIFAFFLQYQLYCLMFTPECFEYRTVLCFFCFTIYCIECLPCAVTAVVSVFSKI